MSGGMAEGLAGVVAVAAGMGLIAGIQLGFYRLVEKHRAGTIYEGLSGTLHSCNRHVDLPTGWKTGQWEWRECGRNLEDHTLTEDMWVYTWNDTGSLEKWRPVHGVGTRRVRSLPPVDPLAREIDDLAKRRRA